jgi:hypothetical protein
MMEHITMSTTNEATFVRLSMTDPSELTREELDAALVWAHGKGIQATKDIKADPDNLDRQLDLKDATERYEAILSELQARWADAAATRPADQFEGAAEGVTHGLYDLRISLGWKHEDAVKVGIGDDAVRPDYVPQPEVTNSSTGSRRQGGVGSYEGYSDYSTWK